MSSSKRKQSSENSLLLPNNPGEELLSPQDWVELAVQLGLTPREMQVTILLFEGKTRDTIARRLKLKPRTVREHLERIHGKLNVKDRVGLVLRVMRVHLSLVRDGLDSTR